MESMYQHQPHKQRAEVASEIQDKSRISDKKQLRPMAQAPRRHSRLTAIGPAWKGLKSLDHPTNWVAAESCLQEYLPDNRVVSKVLTQVYYQMYTFLAALHKHTRLPN